ncbi:MAG: hypothetical protein EPN57_18305 [Paraburkholderia sp.]|nr:MAG: hypothetical protein EPN57_18305 [Paraburkholderia sp.]
MKILTGTVGNIRYSTRTSGSKYGGTSTSQVALFEIDGVPVTLSLPEVIAIAEGDKVSVAGNAKRGLFRGLAYCNMSNKVKGKSSVALYCFVGGAFCCSIVFAPIGLWLLYCSYRNQKAYAAIDIPLTVNLEEPIGGLR